MNCLINDDSKGDVRYSNVISEEESDLSDVENVSLLSPSILQLFHEYMNGPTSRSKSNCELLLRYVAAFFGLMWGLPWMAGAAAAANVFPPDCRSAFRIIFSVGIVVTVGLDGLWVMLEISDSFSKKSSTEFSLSSRSESRIYKKLKYILPPLLACFSCISPVYATVKYNEGAMRLLVIITFVGNFGYGLFGYFRLLDQLYYWKDFQTEKVRYKIGMTNKETILKNISTVLDLETLPHVDEIFKSIFNVSNHEISLARSTPPYLKHLFQVTPTLLICIVSSMIGFYLTRSFFVRVVTSNVFAAYLFAVLSEIPGFVVGVIANYEFFGRMFDSLGGFSADVKRRLVRMEYPRLGVTLPVLIMLVSMFAPTAGAYIIYNTFSEENLNSSIIWGATIIVIFARVIFANFTETQLLQEALLVIFSRTEGENHDLNRRRRLIQYRDVLLNTRASFFQ